MARGNKVYLRTRFQRLGRKRRKLGRFPKPCDAISWSPVRATARAAIRLDPFPFKDALLRHVGEIHGCGMQHNATHTHTKGARVKMPVAARLHHLPSLDRCEETSCPISAGQCRYMHGDRPWLCVLLCMGKPTWHLQQAH